MVIDVFISPDLAHPLLALSVLLPPLESNCDNHTAIQYDYYKLDFKNDNYIVINAKLSEIDWNKELNSLSIIEATDNDKFHTIILTVDKKKPKKHFKISTFPN